MKKLVLLFIALMLSIGANAQHLEFKGIPITGKVKSFSKKLQRQGFTKEIYNVNTYQLFDALPEKSEILQGTFASYYGCHAIILSSPKGNVHKVLVMFPGKNTWNSILEQYNDIVFMYSLKYGEPNKTYAFFNDGQMPKTDEEKLHLAINGDCNFVSFFNLDNGIIMVKISYNPFNRGFGVMAGYEDKIQQESYNLEDTKQIIHDI